MKQKQFLSLLLCGVLLSGLVTGCEKTPEKPIVREKGVQSIENYKEATSTPKSSSNALSERLQVPEKYEASRTDNEGSFQLNCNADVFVPDAAQIPIYKVGPKPFDDAWISQVTEAFFGDAPVYDGYKYFETTKAEALEKLNELKAWQAEGNLDPYGYIASAKEQGFENAEETYNLQKAISLWEQLYNEAPETIEKTELTPGFGLQDQDILYDYFMGAVESGGAVYSYRLRTTAACPMDIRICRAKDAHSMEVEWVATLYDGRDEPVNPSAPSREKAEEMAGITPEQAIEIADGYMEKLGLQNFSAKSTSLSLCVGGISSITPAMETTFSDAGYMVSYTRDVDGFPVTDEFDMGGGLESMSSTSETWIYERIEFYVNKDGLQRVDILNLYQIEEEQVSNVELLSFPEIADIFEEMAAINYSDYTAPDSIELDVKNVKLGYMRIYDPSVDGRHGLLVPVWDFFGTNKTHNVYNGEAIDHTSSNPRWSFLTINAADGSVIDRGLGY